MGPSVKIPHVWVQCRSTALGSSSTHHLQPRTPQRVLPANAGSQPHSKLQVTLALLLLLLRRRRPRAMRRALMAAPLFYLLASGVLPC